MTHDELLSLMDYYQVKGTWDIAVDSERFEMVAKNFRALRAVVKLAQKPFIPKPNTVYLIGYETAMEQVIQAIEKELG